MGQQRLQAPGSLVMIQHPIWLDDDLRSIRDGRTESASAWLGPGPPQQVPHAIERTRNHRVRVACRRICRLGQTRRRHTHVEGVAG